MFMFFLVVFAKEKSQNFEDKNGTVPFVILQFCTSFSQDANDAFNTSVSFLFVPGVSGGICVGISENYLQKVY